MTCFIVHPCWVSRGEKGPIRRGHWDSLCRPIFIPNVNISIVSPSQWRALIPESDLNLYSSFTSIHFSWVEEMWLKVCFDKVTVHLLWKGFRWTCTANILNYVEFPRWKQCTAEANCVITCNRIVRFQFFAKHTHTHTHTHAYLNLTTAAIFLCSSFTVSMGALICLFCNCPSDGLYPRDLCVESILNPWCHLSHA